MAAWTPASWRSKAAVQMAEYDDKQLTEKVLKKLSEVPPLVAKRECDRLKTLLAEAGRGERFIVQGGDCAERFMDCKADRLEAQLTMMLQLGMITEHVSGKPSLCICRIAGQYGKPRSKPTETVEGYGEIMSFKGDNINGFEPTERKWDPERLLQGYFHSAATLNFLRSFTQSAEPMELSKVDISALKDSADFDFLKRSARDIGAKHAAGTSTEFFTAHEAMQLDLEEALTRKVGDEYYNLSAHLVWIGDRTRQINGAHVEYFSGLANPVGCKIGPSMTSEELTELVVKLNPRKEEGKLMIITRYGAGKVENFLPGHIEAVKRTGVPVVWQCDAVHGNGIVAPGNKIKTRKIDDCLQEIFECIAVHKQCGSVFGGVHLECTGQRDVTECLGGCVDLTEEMLTTNYETWCDPRFNHAQSIEAAFKIGAAVKAGA